MMTSTSITIPVLVVLLALTQGCAHGTGHGRETGEPHAAFAKPTSASMADSGTTVPTEPATPRDVSGLFKKDGSAAESDELSDTPDLGRSSDLKPWRSIFATILVLGLLVAINILLRRRIRNTEPGREDASMNLIATLPLDHHRRLLLIAVEGKRALLCSGRDGVASIATFDPPAGRPTCPGVVSERSRTA